MADTHDTIDGLLAEFRGYSAFMPPSYHVTMSWADFRRMLDRIEAAHKRERENYDAKIADLQLRVKLWTDRSDELVKKCVEQYAKLKQVGNAAKLREALEYMFILIDGRHLVLECETTEEISGVQGKLAEARAALAAPPRNCDKVKTSWDVLKKWHEGLDTANDIVRMLDWLLAPATEQEGGAK